MEKQKHTKNWALMLDCGITWQPPADNDLLIGIDDTDNLESPGTGFRARELARLLFDRGLGLPKGITRHQLLVHPLVRYTSHNSSACLCIAGAKDDDAIWQVCRTYLLEASAPGSDAGLCMSRRIDVPADASVWGERAKVDVLDQDGARAIARTHHIRLEGLTGDEGGVIGSLAAVGLHAAGNDGRFLWQKGLRERAGQTLHAAALHAELGTHAATLSGGEPEDADLIELGEWPRAIFRQHQPVLLLEENHEARTKPWRVVAKDTLKQY